MPQIIISALNQDHAIRKAKLDENLGRNVVITDIEVLRKAGTKDFKEGTYRITYKKKEFYDLGLDR